MPFIQIYLGLYSVINKKRRLSVIVGILAAFPALGAVAIANVVDNDDDDDNNDNDNDDNNNNNNNFFFFFFFFKGN